MSQEGDAATGPRRTQALVLAGHGSQYHPRSSAPLFAQADRIRARGCFDEVRTAFWREEPSLRDVRSTVESDVAYVVPVLTSVGYFAADVFPRELGVEPSPPSDGDPAGPTDGPELVYAEPVGTHAAMADVVRARVESTIDGATEDVGVAIVGHGTDRHERSAETTREHASRLRADGRYAEVEAVFLDEAPFVGDVTRLLDAPDLVVVPLFVADGRHVTVDVPEALGVPGVDTTTTVDGRRVHYTGAVGTAPELVDVVLQRAVEAGATPGGEAPAGGTPIVDSLGPAGGAFLSRVDSAATGREWGELAVSRDVDGYDLRHRDDVTAERAELQALGRPVALREHVRFDRGGRYRPLSGARTLPTGWVLAGLDDAAAVRAVEFVYPGSVGQWHRARTHGLETTDFAETASRQRGDDAGLSAFEGEELAATVDAVCGDCVRTRCWGVGEDESRHDRPIDAIPCREACPFLRSAARTFQESSDLAAAEVDPAVPAGALDRTGNRYRVRYARALARRRGLDRRGEPASGRDLTSGRRRTVDAAAQPTGGRADATHSTGGSDR